MDRERLLRLNIVPEYPDNFGQWHHLDEDTARRLLHAMDLPEDAQQLPDSDDVIVARAGWSREAPHGELELEDGGGRPIGGVLPDDLPLGYHTLHRTDGGESTVVVSPGRCLPHPGRRWGLAVQLYSARSAASWGVGDLADLRQLGDWAAAEGADFALVNPLDAVTPEQPREQSPYFPSSRRFRDVLYLRVEEVPGIEVVGSRLRSLAASAEGELIDRDAVVAAKLRAIEQVWERARTAGREPGFERYRSEQGEALETFSTFMTLAERHGGGWRSWPSELQDPGSAAVAEAAAAGSDRRRFHAWVQWLLDEQLREAATALPLMRDLPIGFDPDGADAWAWQDVVAGGVTIGAPPDELGPQGQDWMMPPFVPWKLHAARYRPFVETVRSAFRHASALRIDHVLGLFRLFWIPGDAPAGGAYVRQHTNELLDILALESHRAGAYVVGEDLGTVEPGVREQLAARDMLRYQVLWFEDEPPARWEPQGLGSISTHDLPTVAGAWERTDLDEYRRVGLPVDGSGVEQLRDRLATRTGVDDDAAPGRVCVAAAELLASAGSDLVVAQLEDVVGATHRINLPGTTSSQRPANWSVPLPVTLDELADLPLAARVMAALRERSQT
jgi:4-alpha-glucanotransferase